MAVFRNRFTKVQAGIFIGLLAVFTALTFYITDSGIDNGSNHGVRVLQTTAVTIAGPLTGAVSRGFQRCCLDFSLWLMAYCAPVLLLGLIAPFLNLPERKGVRFLRTGLWTLGWLVWFAGGIVSFGHALS